MPSEHEVERYGLRVDEGAGEQPQSFTREACRVVAAHGDSNQGSAGRRRASARLTRVGAEANPGTVRPEKADTS
jgi:hypothetical protein